MSALLSSANRLIANSSLDVPTGLKYHPVQSPGAAVQIIWNDGKEATLLLDRSEPKQVPVNLKITENTCTGIKPSGCYIEIDMFHQRFELQWTKFPTDPAKVGQPVKRVFSGAEDAYDLLSREETIQIKESKTTKPYNVPLRPTRLVCSDFKWLPGVPTQPVVIGYWNTQRMADNPETKVNETRIHTVARGISLRHVSETALEFDWIRQYVADYTQESFYEGDMAIWSFFDSGKHCHIEVTFEDLRASRTLDELKRGELKPYIFGTDPEIDMTWLGTSLYNQSNVTYPDGKNTTVFTELELR